MTPLYDERMTPEPETLINSKKGATRGPRPSPVSRFAPSPTGRLHEGHAFSALVAHELSAGAGGAFRLRIEDLDQGRSRAEFVEGIYEDLEWLGLEWAEPVLVQSERSGVYQEALRELLAMGVAYPCFCTRRDIAAAGAAPHGPDGPLYPGTCRDLGREGTARAEGEAHAIRLDAAAAATLTGPLAFADKGRSVKVDPELLGDVVLARKDAAAAYHLAATLDDAAQDVTLIVRGEDLLPSTHVHRVLQALLGLRAPSYHHHRLLLGPDGERLSKRNGARPLADLRAAGISAEDLASRLRSLAAEDRAAN